MKRLQFIILMLTMFCTGLVASNVESYANDPPGINIDINADYDVIAENFEFNLVSVEGVFAVYSCDLILWYGVEYSIIQSSDIINNITGISVLNKGSTDNSLYAYTLLRLTDRDKLIARDDSYNVNDCWMPMKASGGEQSGLFLRIYNKNTFS